MELLHPRLKAKAKVSLCCLMTASLYSCPSLSMFVILQGYIPAWTSQGLNSGWGVGSGGWGGQLSWRVLFYHVQGPEFHPQHWKKQTNQTKAFSHPVHHPSFTCLQAWRTALLSTSYPSLKLRSPCPHPPTSSPCLIGHHHASI